MTLVARYTSTRPAPRTAYASPVRAPMMSVSWVMLQPRMSAASVTSATLAAEAHGPHEIVAFQQLLGRALEPDLALLHEHGAIGHRERHVHGLLDDHHRDALSLEALDDPEQLLHDD